MDNLNTHNTSSLYEAFPAEEAFRLAQRLEIHYTPKHGSWLNIAECELSASARLYLFDLDDGEAETIILAQEQAADIAIIDEKLGRRYATQLNIPVTGTIGILLKAKEHGIIPVVAPLLQELRNKSSWIDDPLFQKALSIAGELG